MHFIILLVFVILNCTPTVHGECGERRLTAAEESEFLLTQDEANNFLHINSKIILTPNELIGKKMDIVRRRLCGHEDAERSREQNKKCTCYNGAGATGSSCPSNGALRCSSCSTNFQLSNGYCLSCAPVTARKGHTAW